MSRRRVSSGEAGMPDRDAGLSPRQKRRLTWLFALLGVAILAFALTSGWRQQLRRDSARYRAMIAETAEEQEAERFAREQVAALGGQLRQDPGNHQLRMQLAQIVWQRNGPAAATQVLDGAKPPPDDPVFARMLAHCCRLIGREDRALETLDLAIRRHPREGDLRADRALLYVLLGWRRDAAREFEAAVALRSGEADLARAALLRAQESLVAARQVLEARARKHPGDPDLVRQLADIAEDEGRYGEAIRLLRSLVPLTPRDRVALAAALARRAQAGDLEEAVRLADEVLREGSLPNRTRLLLGHCLRRLGRLAEARRHLEELYRTSPRTYGAAFELGEISRREGRFEEAQRLLGEHRKQNRERSELRRASAAVFRNAGDAQAHLAVGRLCLERGMYGRAVVEIRRAVELGENHAGAAALLARARRALASGAAAHGQSPDA